MRVISAQMRNRENIVPMLAAVAVEVVALLLLVPRLGLLGAGLGLSVMQIMLCATLAGRLGLFQDFVRRVPGWLVGGVVAGAAAALSMRLDAPVFVRLCVISTCVLAAWVAGTSVSAVTRGDLRVLRTRVGQAVQRLRLRAAEAVR
jgi:O-antigen/teichoic acid export membrane protein